MKFKTVKDIMEQLKNFPEDAEVHIAHYSSFLDENLQNTHGRITDKVAYRMFPADNVEYGEFYEDAWNSNPRGYIKRKCVIVSPG